MVPLLTIRGLMEAVDAFLEFGPDNILLGLLMAVFFFIGVRAMHHRKDIHDFINPSIEKQRPSIDDIKLSVKSLILNKEPVTKDIFLNNDYLHDKVIEEVIFEIVEKYVKEKENVPIYIVLTYPNVLKKLKRKHQWPFIFYKNGIL